MVNPPNPYQYSGSFEDVLKRMLRHATQDQVDAQILEILRRVFENELGREKPLLSRPKRNLLFQQLSKAILADVLDKIGGNK